MYITDLRHFLDAAGTIGPTQGPARAMAQFHADVVAHASNLAGQALAAPRCFKCKKSGVDAGVAQTPPLSGSARDVVPKAASRTGRARCGICATGRRRAVDRGCAVGLSSRLFLLGGDDALHVLAGTAFARMLQQEDTARLPDFAGQRLRLASLVIELADRMPQRVLRASCSVIGIGSDGRLDVARLHAQQIARGDSFMAKALGESRCEAAVVDAAARFVARGGSWQPDHRLLRRIEAAALGRFPCRSRPIGPLTRGSDKTAACLRGGRPIERHGGADERLFRL